MIETSVEIKLNTKKYEIKQELIDCILEHGVFIESSGYDATRQLYTFSTDTKLTKGQVIEMIDYRLREFIDYVRILTPEKKSIPEIQAEPSPFKTGLELMNH